MKRILLTKGKFTIVDDADYEFLNQWRWKYHKDGYAVRGATGNKNIYMHRVVNKTPAGMLTDHINRDRLDNRSKNLRIASYSKNALNTKMFGHNTSGVKGVYWSKQKMKWHARIQIAGKHLHLGFFSNIKEAARARKLLDKKYAV